jgi:hypothetical protein
MKKLNIRLFMGRLALLISFIFSFQLSGLSQLLPREKRAKMEREFGNLSTDGMTWNSFGDLVFEKNGKYYWLTTYTNVQQAPFDYFRLFEIDLVNDQMVEVTTKMLGGYFRVEIGRTPYYYEDLDNDGIKDIFVFDLGQELLSIPPQNWNYFNTYFKGTETGFVKTDIPIITTEERYHHAHSLKDFDGDGDLDIAFSADYPRIFLNDGKGNFNEMQISNLVNPPNDNRLLFLINGKYYNSGSFSMKFTNLDSDKELEILFPVHNRPIFLDFINGRWEAKIFGEEKAFVFKENIHIGVEDILEIPNGSKNDLFFRIATYDTPINGNGNQKWMTKFFYSKSNELEKVEEFKNSFLDANSCFFLDPKLVDINFDGYLDLFFKEDEFWGNTGQQLHKIENRIWLNDGENNFAPINYKFNEDVRKLVYTFGYSDPNKKTTLLFSQRRTSINENGVFQNDNAYLFNRFDYLVFPINKAVAKNACQGIKIYEKLTLAPINFKLISSSSDSQISFDEFGINYTANKAGVDTITYRIFNDFFESENFQLIVNSLENEAPILSLKNSIQVQLDINGKYILKNEDVNLQSKDNCGITQWIFSKPILTCADLGTNKVTVSAKDASGNTSSAEVTVTAVDEIKPTAKVKSGYVIKLDVQGKATLKWEDIDDGSTDNCSITERKLSKTEFTRTDGGDNKITYTITDTSGNTSSSDLTVRVDIVLSAPERPLESNTVKAYPNPVHDYLYLEFAEGISSIRTSSLVDASGKVLGELNLEDAGNGRLGFSTRDLKTGLYFLRLGTRDTLHLIKFTVIY